MNDSEEKHHNVRQFAKLLDEEHDLSENCSVVVEMVLANLNHIHTDDIHSLLKIHDVHPHAAAASLLQHLVATLDIVSARRFFRPKTMLSAPFDFGEDCTEHIDMKTNTTTLSRGAKRAYNALRVVAKNTQQKMAKSEHFGERMDILSQDLRQYVVETLQKRAHQERRHLQILHVCTAAMLCLRTPDTKQIQKICRITQNTTTWTLSADQRRKTAEYMKQHGRWTESVEFLDAFISKLVASKISFPGYYYTQELRYKSEEYEAHFRNTRRLLAYEQLPPWTVDMDYLDGRTLAYTDYTEREITFDSRFLMDEEKENIYRIYVTAAHEMAHALCRGAKHGILSGFRRVALSLGDPRPRVSECHARVHGR
jgi:hypothetical protein